MIDVHLGTAFLAGVLTFFAPCTLPLLPAFLGLSSASGFDSRQGVFFRSLGFVLGFLVVFMGLGIFAGVLGSFFFVHRTLLTTIGGAIVILFALILLDVIRVPALASRIAPKFRFPIHRTSPISTFFIGFAFALGWTPCLGPILGSILVLASTEGTALAGGVLLFSYGMGIAVPFLIFALGLSEAVFRSPRVLKLSVWISRFGGVFLLFLGFALLLGYWGNIVSFLTPTTPFFGWDAYISNL